MVERRFSRQRERIYQAVCAARSHPTAQMVYDDLKQEFPKLSLGTVYRNLHQMAGMAGMTSGWTVHGHSLIFRGICPVCAGE